MDKQAGQLLYRTERPVARHRRCTGRNRIQPQPARLCERKAESYLFFAAKTSYADHRRVNRPDKRLSGTTQRHYFI